MSLSRQLFIVEEEEEQNMHPRAHPEITDLYEKKKMGHPGGVNLTTRATDCQR